MVSIRSNRRYWIEPNVQVQLNDQSRVELFHSARDYLYINYKHNNEYKYIRGEIAGTFIQLLYIVFEYIPNQSVTIELLELQLRPVQ